MRQVPGYVIVGNGRMARHMCHYLDLLSIPYQQWYRSDYDFSLLSDLILNASHLLILISDSQIDSFIKSHVEKRDNLCVVHFSGSLNLSYAYSAHPLQTFSVEYYTLDEYQSIPFVIEHDSRPFSELLPGLSNPHYAIQAKDKAYYHAMCVMANNFSTLLWQKFTFEMTQRFGISQTDLKPYLARTHMNIASNPFSALTGPLQRRDIRTLQNNLNALKGDEYYSVFEAFVQQFVPELNHEIT